MNKRKRTGRIALALLISGIVFLTNTIAMLLTIVAIYGLARLGVIETTGGQVGLPELLRFFFYTSLVIGFLLASLTGKIILKPIKRIIDQLDRLASGDFKTRLHFGKPIADHPTFKQVEKSFNRAAEELDYTEMLRSDFINNFSHEFKTPIVSVLGFAKLLKSDQLTKDQRKEYLDIIIEESRRLSELSTTILDLSRIESLSSLSGQTTFSLSEQIREAILLLEYKWSQKHLKLDLNLEELDILADEALLKQVWINLLDNGIKFSPEFGKLSVSLHTKDGTCIVKVQDHGPGMDQATSDLIFTKFYQGDTSHQSEGNGLGLALVKKIIELHRGTVTVESNTGKGSTFIVVLPL